MLMVSDGPWSLLGRFANHKTAKHALSTAVAHLLMNWLVLLLKGICAPTLKSFVTSICPTGGARASRMCAAFEE